MPPSETPVGLSDEQLLAAIEKLSLATGDMIIVRAPKSAPQLELSQWARNLARLSQLTGHVVLVAPTDTDVVAYPQTELISVMQNAIGFSLFGVTDGEATSIDVSDEDVAKCGAAAKLAYEHLVAWITGGAS